MSFKYIQDSYKVPAYKGARVEYTETNGEVRRGTITGTTGAHLLVKLDGPKQKAGKYHPTWNLKYLKVEWVVLLAGNDEKQIWYGPRGEHKYNQSEAQRFKSKAAATRARNSVARYWSEAKVVEVDKDGGET